MWWARYLGTALVVVAVIVGAMLLAAVNVTYTAKTIGTLHSKRSLPNRTAAACLNRQDCELAKSAPIASFAEYRRCGGVVSAARLKGQPLACSEQWATDLLLRDWSNPGQSAYRQLRRGCRTHDLCYVHGRATYGADQLQCDDEFLAENLRECWMIYSSEAKEEQDAKNQGAKALQRYFDLKPWYSRWLGIDRDEFRVACQTRASVAYLAVRIGGENYFGRHEGVLCDYEGGPHAARDKVATGRFLGGDQDYVITLSLARDQDVLSVRLLSFGPNGQSQDVADPILISPARVLVGDRDWACQRRLTPDGGFSADCPEWLGQSALDTSAAWLQFEPIVVDSDGDGMDELVIPSLTPDFGLVFTHILTRRSGPIVSFEPVRAYLGVARMAKAEATDGGCEDQLEFVDCSGTAGDGSTPSTPSEAAAQNAAYQFTVATSADATCPPDGQPSKQDILQFSAFSHFPQNPGQDVQKVGGWHADYVMRRFAFNPALQRWVMRRDRFNNDWHRMAGCSIRESRDQFQTHSRLQYPPLVVRLPKKQPAEGGAPVCTPDDERLAFISRDKCPTSTPVARAGGLNDVDLMLYRIKQSYTFASNEEKKEKYPDYYDELMMAQVHWKPILWPETADPAVTSRAARENGIVMVGAFIGGTKEIGRGGEDARREGHHPVVAVVRVNQLQRLTIKDFDRYADTMGQVPDLYGVFKSSSFPASTSERVSNLWDPKRYGPARIYFQIPSLLAPFDANGAKGVSLVFFSNRALWLQGESAAPEHSSQPLPIEDGIFRIMIVPIAFKDPLKEVEQPGMIDCPVDAIGDAAEAPARRVGMDPYFLRREPVLAGKFLASDAGGSLAVTWRDANGEIRLTALHFDDGKWKFGGKECARPEGMDKNELFRLRIN